MAIVSLGSLLGVMSLLISPLPLQFRHLKFANHELVSNLKLTALFAGLDVHNSGPLNRPHCYFRLPFLAAARPLRDVPEPGFASVSRFTVIDVSSERICTMAMALSCGRRSAAGNS
jgi:hypothetical protein